VALPWPKVPHRLPDILSGTEVDALLSAVEPLLHRAVVMTAYGTGLRIREACSLRADDCNPPLSDSVFGVPAFRLRR
jgi:integrase